MKFNKETILKLSEAERFLEFSDCSAHIKSLVSGKYELTNRNNLKLFNLNNPDNLVGLSLDDINQFMYKYWGNTRNEVEFYDNQIKYNSNVIVDNSRFWINYDGFLWFHQMTKIPVMDLKGNINFVLTLTDTVNNVIKVEKLFNLYLKTFQNKKQAISLFLKHIKLDIFFYDNILPTEQELNIILCKYRHLQNKQISNHLSKNISTIDKQIKSFKDKIKQGFSFEILLSEIKNEY